MKTTTIFVIGLAGMGAMAADDSILPWNKNDIPEFKVD